ncbi:MAG: phosphatidylglycerophosphate synthase [Gammaproteobacteria bacterium]|jgi:phosphatidylglycerophosphate synthase
MLNKCEYVSPQGCRAPLLPESSGIETPIMNTLPHDHSVGAPLVTALVVGVALALCAKQGLALSGLYLIKVACVLAFVVWLLHRAMRRSSGHNGHFGLANQVTLARAVLVVLLLGLLGEDGGAQVMWSAVIIAAMASVTDALDGWLARRMGIVSDFGARFDMETDAALIAVLALLAWTWQRAGDWVLLAGAARYVFVVGTYYCHWMRAQLPSSLRRKVVCVLQVVTLVVCLVPLLTPAASALIAAAGVFALLGSFTVDTLWLARHSRDLSRGE